MVAFAPMTWGRKPPSEPEHHWIGRDQVSSEPSGTSQFDPETLEMVQKFEALYAELAPPTLAPASEAPQLGDLMIDLPDESQRVPFRGQPRAPAGYEGPSDPVQRIDALRHRATVAAGPSASMVDEKLHIEAAFALRAAEAEGPAAARNTVPENGAAEALASGHSSTTLQPTRCSRASETREVASVAGAPAARNDCAARAGWLKIVGAGAIALIIGAGVGYIAGTGLVSDMSHAKIEISPNGGTQLRLEYELQRR